MAGALPPVPAIVKSTWQQLVATGLDQFGTKLTAQPTFTWSVVSGMAGCGLSRPPDSVRAANEQRRRRWSVASSGAISGQVALSVLNTAQLKADYSFNETSGWNLQDTLGVGITAKMSGGATLVTTPGHLGDAVNFDGIMARFGLAISDSLDIRGQITMAAWIKLNFHIRHAVNDRGNALPPTFQTSPRLYLHQQWAVSRWFYDASNFRNRCSSRILLATFGQWFNGWSARTTVRANWNLYRNGTLSLHIRQFQRSRLVSLNSGVSAAMEPTGQVSFRRLDISGQVCMRRPLPATVEVSVCCVQLKRWS